MKKQLLLAALLICSITSAISAQEPVNDSIITIIKKHGMDQSRVMETAAMITDVYGPRMTGSPMLDKATTWATQQLKDWGYQNVHLDEWGPFGRGWELKHFEMHCEAPSYWPIIAYPKAWSPSTKGTVTGEVVYLDASTEEDLEKYRKSELFKGVWAKTKILFAEKAEAWTLENSTFKIDIPETNLEF